MTSGSGQTVECNDALFIMTANLAIDEIEKFGKILEQRYKKTTNNVSQNDNLISKEEFIKEFKQELLHGPLKVIQE